MSTASMQVVPVVEPAAYLAKLRGLKDYGQSGINPFRAIRRSFDITQSRAAFHVGVPRSLWLAWERQERPISVEQLGRVQQAFSLERGEIQWVLDWWGDARVATLTIAQLNVLSDQVGNDAVDVVELLFRVWRGSGIADGLG